MYTILVVLHVLVSIALIGLVLIQHGKGADAGAAFGSGASGTVFGSRGSANFLTRITAWLAGAFFLLSLALAYVVHGKSASSSVVDQAPAAVVSEPVVPAVTSEGGAVPAPTPAPEVPAPSPAAPTAPAGNDSAPGSQKPSVPQ
ncbi:preprotein translocase subunit SecG [uncultured Nevskia sp.]|uniref:preprotein translocase subunit SecG n=1 Tax=uncultured Nevskia sp. TaxID=228950 RepID=UPI0025D213F2|nr:preprotein translocase subunit SecG [uncultured Nevskia sp.]